MCEEQWSLKAINSVAVWLRLYSNIERDDLSSNGCDNPRNPPLGNKVKVTNVQRTRCDIEDRRLGLDVAGVVHVYHSTLCRTVRCDGKIFRICWRPPEQMKHSGKTFTPGTSNVPKLRAPLWERGPHYGWFSALQF